MPGGDYTWYQRLNQRVGGSVAFNTTGVSGAAVLIGGTGSASGAIFVQRIDVEVTTTGAVNWAFQDSSGPTLFTPAISMTGSGFNRDFGPRGYQLPTGASLQISGSASGAAGIVTWEGYKAYMGGTSVGFFPASGASGTTP